MGGHQRAVRGDPGKCHIEYQRAPAHVPARDGKLQGLQCDDFELICVSDALQEGIQAAEIILNLF